LKSISFLFYSRPSASRPCFACCREFEYHPNINSHLVGFACYHCLHTSDISHRLVQELEVKCRCGPLLAATKFEICRKGMQNVCSSFGKQTLCLLQPGCSNTARFQVPRIHCRICQATSSVAKGRLGEGSTGRNISLKFLFGSE
jgi:hypothetical protein